MVGYETDDDTYDHGYSKYDDNDLRHSWAESNGLTALVDAVETVVTFKSPHKKTYWPVEDMVIQVSQPSVTKPTSEGSVPGTSDTACRPLSLSLTTSETLSYNLNNKDDVQRLYDLCNPAPYGDLAKQKTVIDTSVRDARYLDASHVHIPHLTQGDRRPADRLYELAQRAFPAEVIEVVPYRFNMYMKGGHFRKHVDTPQPNTIGTLVAVLTPSKQAFQLFHPHDRSNMLEELEVDEEEIGLIAYPSHYPHAVPEVKEFVRCSMVYTILRCPAPNESEPDEPPTKVARKRSRVTECLQQVLEAYDAPVAFITGKQYTMAAVRGAPPSDGSSASGQFDFLQGTDAKLLQEVDLDADLRAHVMCVSFCIKGRDTGEELTTKAGNVFIVTDDSMEAGMKALMAQPAPLKAPTPDTPFKHNGNDAICIYLPGLSKLNDPIVLSSEEYIEYTGNECQEGSYEHLYFHCAIVFSLASMRRVA
jgi:hypothetical protein